VDEQRVRRSHLPVEYEAIVWLLDLHQHLNDALRIGLGIVVGHSLHHPLVFDWGNKENLEEIAKDNRFFFVFSLCCHFDGTAVFSSFVLFFVGPSLESEVAALMP
jgi:hypothetical protein